MLQKIIRFMNALVREVGVVIGCMAVGHYIACVVFEHPPEPKFMIVLYWAAGVITIIAIVSWGLDFIKQNTGGKNVNDKGGI